MSEALPSISYSPMPSKMDGLKRSRHQLGEADDERTAPDKRARTESSEVSSISSRLPLASAPVKPMQPAPVHMSVISDVTKRIQGAVQDGWSRKVSNYSAIYVLMLFWDDDEPDLGADIERLDDVFRTTYHFGTEKHAVKSPSADSDFQAITTDFVNRNGLSENLLICFYAGNAQPNPQLGELPLWTPRRQRGITARSEAVQSLLDAADCDTLLLYDCPSAEPSVVDGEGAGPLRRNVKEVVTAGSLHGVPADGAPNKAFTRTLADELLSASKSGPLRVVDLHARLSARLVTAKPRGRGRPPKEPQFRPLEGQQIPMHYWLSEPKRTILLAPFSNTNEPHVLLCIRILQGGPVVSEWIGWIAHAPAPDSIDIEGVYAGFATLVILRVPFAIWDQLPDCPNGSFVGFATTGNVSAEMRDRVDARLAKKLGIEDDQAAAVVPRPPVGFVSAGAAPPPLPMHAANLDEDEDGYSLRGNPKKSRKALPSGRKLLPSQRTALPMERGELVGGGEQYDGREFAPPPSPTERKALPSARKPVKISIKSAGALHYCPECAGVGFKDEEGLANHTRKQHTRPFQCVYNWAGCDSTFASKNEWKRHVTSQHILLSYWLCQLDACAKTVNTKSNTAGKLVEPNGHVRRQPSLPNGTIFNRKDLYTQHLRRMHTPPTIKKQAKQAKAANKSPTSAAAQDWEERLKDLQQMGLKERCKLPTYMKCPAAGCDLEFNGANAWDDRMEHVAKHLEKAAAGKEQHVVFGGPSDPTLTDWSTLPEVGIVKAVGANGWQLNNPLQPKTIGIDPTARERSKSVIEVAENEDRDSLDDE